MPQWPHWYIVHGKANRCEEFNRFAKLIKKHGKDERWGRQIFRYLRVGSYKYWVMGEIINRAAPIPSSEVLRRGEEWLRRHRKKIGPHGNLIPISKPQAQKRRRLKASHRADRQEQPLLVRFHRGLSLQH